MINLPNLLNLALKVTGGQGAVWKKFSGRTQDPRGNWVTDYEQIPIFGSWQAVDTATMKNLGLDTRKIYKNFYTSNPVRPVNRGESPDQVIVNGEVYEIYGGPDWHDQNGWVGLLCVKV